MKHFYRLLALFMALCMIFPLSACLGEEAVETTEPPATSAVETTAEKTEPPVEETTEPLSELYSMTPLELIRQANKKTKEYKTYVKTTSVTLDIANVGEQKREMTYMQTENDFSQSTYIDDELYEFIMYSDGKFAIYESILGNKGFSTDLKHDLGYELLFGEKPPKSGNLIFDFEGMRCFEGGIVSYTDEGFTVAIGLSEKGISEFITKIRTNIHDHYVVENPNIVVLLDKDGNIDNVSFDANITITRNGKDIRMAMSASSALENINESIAVEAPEGLNFFNFSSVDKFEQSYAAISYPFDRVYNDGADFYFKNTLYIDIVENDRADLLLQREASGLYDAEKGISLYSDIKLKGEGSHEEYHYYMDRDMAYHVDNAGKVEFVPDMSGEDLYNEALRGMFFGYVGDFSAKGSISSSSKFEGYEYEAFPSDEAIKTLTDYYLKLCSIDPASCDEITASGSTVFTAPSKNQAISGFRIYLTIKIKSGNREYSLNIKDRWSIGTDGGNFIGIPGFDEK